MPWHHIETELDGRPAQLLLDDRFRDSAPVRELPGLAWFCVHCRNPPDIGYWDDAESETLEKIEDDLIELCSRFGKGWAVYVLRIATRGLREYFVYYGGDAELPSVASSLTRAHPSYCIDFETRPDSSWQRYTSMLSALP
jgi:hypothetical protein